MELESSQSYANFRAWCPRKEVGIGVLHPITWRYYDWGPRTYLEPIICLHSLIGSAECFYQQILSLAPRGYRVISIQIPIYWTIAEFCDAFHAFLETIPHRRVHLYGAGLGGFLAMHYAVRKPDDIASLILTHSFLATESLNLHVPYSTSVLRWLPDFLVRSTVRAILPKGKVSLEMADAAEFAIGHTINCSREVLASRLALSTTSSTVVSRIHIPQNTITLIDTLDRQPRSLQLLELTASQLPESRRAYLKFGGDFPYLAAADDVNVHLIVHLRRNAADPVLDIAIPVPARPRVSPAITRRRRALEQARQLAEQAEKEENKASTKKQKRTRKSDDDLQREATALVVADEKSRVERFAFEIGRLRGFLQDRDDAYLAAVLEECDGILDVAIANARAEMYDDRFYEETLVLAIASKVQQLQEAEEEQGGERTGGNGAVMAGNENDGDGIDAQSLSLDENNTEIDVAPAFVAERALDQDQLGLSENLVQDVSAKSNNEDNREGDEENTNMADGVTITELSPPLNSPEQDTQAFDMNEDGPLLGLGAKSSGSAMLGMDPSANELYLNTERGAEQQLDEDSEADGSTSSSRRENDAGNRRQRRTRRRSYPKDEDQVGAYVTSEKVGMRSRGPLVGRGPAPFSNAAIETGLSPGEAWKRTARVRDEEDSSVNDEKATHVSLSSGASLLEANENPLELPGHESKYMSDRGQHKSDNVVGPGLAVTSPQSRLGHEKAGSVGRGSPPMIPPQQSGSFSRDTALKSPEAELVLGSSVLEPVVGPGTKERDEWESFRRRGRGLATAISPTPRVGFERKLEGAIEAMSGSHEEMDGVAGESEESARLREWRMSAQAASKNVHR